MQGTVSDEVADFCAAVEPVAEGQGFLKRCLFAGRLHDFFGFMKREFVQVNFSLGLPDHLPFWVVRLAWGMLLFVGFF